MSTLLVPTDFEQCSERSLEVATELARDLGATIVLMHVIPLPILPYPNVPADLINKMNAEAHRAGREALEKLATRTGGARLVCEGDPAIAILHAIDELRPRMVVMGTHGRGPLKRLLLGSVAEQVLRRSPVPVVTVSASAASTQPERADDAELRAVA